MTVRACLTTGRGSAAIATVCVFGPGSREVVNAVFRSRSGGKLDVGSVLVGDIVDGEKVIDQVVVGCEGDEEFAISCHGNPVITGAILANLEKHTAKIVDAKEYAWFASKQSNPESLIAAEAYNQQYQCKTVEGVRLILNQASEGLGRWAREKLGVGGSEWERKVQSEAQEILSAGERARYIVEGCTAVLVGATNSGKSTLMNAMAGRERSIVTEVSGTTRDYVTAELTSGELFLKLIDTAGISAELANEADIAAQAKTSEMLGKADIVLIVVDASRPGEVNVELLREAGDREILVINKSDIAGVNEADWPGMDRVVVSAKTGEGVEKIAVKIREKLGTFNFDLQTPVWFTARQRELLAYLSRCNDETQARRLISELLNGPGAV